MRRLFAISTSWSLSSIAWSNKDGDSIASCFQAEDGIRDIGVTGVQTCALPICASSPRGRFRTCVRSSRGPTARRLTGILAVLVAAAAVPACAAGGPPAPQLRTPESVEELFVMYSAHVPREAPALFDRYFSHGDYARAESLRPDADVARR